MDKNGLRVSFTFKCCFIFVLNKKEMSKTLAALVMAVLLMTTITAMKLSSEHLAANDNTKTTTPPPATAANTAGVKPDAPKTETKPVVVDPKAPVNPKAAQKKPEEKKPEPKIETKTEVKT